MRKKCSFERKHASPSKFIWHIYDVCMRALASESTMQAVLDLGKSERFQGTYYSPEGSASLVWISYSVTITS
jgi:hypothetical protein